MIYDSIAHLEVYRNVHPGVYRGLRLLAETDRSVGDIAQQVGYENQSKFSKVFRDHFQVLPTAYRREHGGYPDKKPGDR